MSAKPEKLNQVSKQICSISKFFLQLFMIDQIRTGILAVEGAADDIEEDFSSMEKGEGEVSIQMNTQDLV